MARDWILAGHIICLGRPLNSFAVHRAANNIDLDQTEHTLFAKKCFIVISVFSAIEILFISIM